MDRLSDYDYHLPDELIAQTPLEDRAASKLLWARKDGAIEHRSFRDAVGLLEPGDVLVMNDTRVSALRLIGKKATGASVEALLLRALGGGKYEAMMKPGKRLSPGTRITFQEDLVGLVETNLEDGLKVIQFEPIDGFQDRIDRVGLVPLPPYIHTALADRERYQTVYAVTDGSAAAPTAGLHFTPQILEACEQKGVKVAKVTLDVGIDTFRPVQAEDLSEHKMHGERCQISEEVAETINTAKGRVIAVGTTSVRTLESFADGPKRVRAGCQESKLFIRPGFEFKVVDGMFTNFHLPKTTMLLMLSAMLGRDQVFRAYTEAVREGYRFLSFGDSMLIT